MVGATSVARHGELAGLRSSPGIPNMTAGHLTHERPLLVRARLPRRPVEL